MEQWQQGTVVENKRWNDRLCSLKIDVTLPDFEAGQFIRVGLPDLGGGGGVDGEANKIAARPYSFVNAPHEALLEIYFNQVPKGSLSNRLHALREGDAIYVAGRATGKMTLSEMPAGQTLWLLCTGTALGPFLSILKTQPAWQQFEKIVLVHGVRRADELNYVDLITKLQQRHSEQLIKVNSVTQELLEDVLTQRIPDAISNGELEEKVAIPFDVKTSRVMICGNPEMVAASLDALQAKGLHKHLRREPGQLLQEIYK